MLRRFGWQILAVALLITLLIGVGGGCSQQPPPAPKAGESGPAAKTGPPAQASPAAPPSAVSPEPAAKAAASPAAAVSRVEPKGKVVYIWNTSLTPAWMDPQENQALHTPYAFQYAIHDALVKHMPGQVFTPSLAESYEIAPDFKSATFKLREGIKFHNGDPVTSEDAKFTFEKYRGSQAKILKDKTDRIETPDARTIKFFFKEPFLDFQILYGSPASGAGWVVPKKYYEQVGPDGFKQNPIGAGPFKVVRHVAGSEFELEAVPDYWRKAPHVKTIVVKGIAEDATRLAALQTGEADLLAQITAPLIETVRNDPNVQFAPVLGNTFWLEFPGFEKPTSPFHNIKVREAISLALDREAINQAETAGFSRALGNWIPDNWPGALDWPVFPHDPAKAKQLLAEAGFPNGFDVEELTPLPTFWSQGERIITQLRAVGIRVGKLTQMERAAFTTKLTEGPDAFKGLILNISGTPGDAAGRIRAFAICPPKGSTSRTCVPEIDTKFEQYERSTDLKERERLVNEIQVYILENYIFVPVYRNLVPNVQGPRIANQWEEIWGAIPQHPTLGPYEDIRLKE